jgi:hypothetical protein
VRPGLILPSACAVSRAANWDNSTRRSFIFTRGTLSYPGQGTRQTLGCMLTRLRRQARLWSAYWRLYPLWTMLRQVIPEVELPAEPALRRGIRYRLHRRVIEIRDAQLMLWPYADPKIASLAAGAARSSGMDPAEALAAAEAAVIVDSLQSRLRGRPPRDGEPPAKHVSAACAGDVLAEAAWLVMVSRAVRRSGII